MPRKRKHVECAASFTGSTTKRIKYGATQLPGNEVSALSRRWRGPKIKTGTETTSKHGVAIRADREECTSGQQNKDTSTKRSRLQRVLDAPSEIQLDFPARSSVEVPDQPTCVSKDSRGLQVCRRGKHQKVHTGPFFEAPSSIRNGYQYSPITTDQFRLLILQPGVFDQEIQGDLITVDNDTTPSYEALSYTWGDPTPGTAIAIRTQQRDSSYSYQLWAGSSVFSRRKGRPRQRMSVRTNLYQALKSLRLLDRPRYLWVDAICIDQFNLQERNHQVQMMGKIFSSAHNVCVWLGNDGAQLDSLNRRSHLMADVSIETIHDTLKPEKYESMLADSDQMWRFVNMFDLMNRRWFSRLWIIQEITLAKKATIHCGSHTVDWMDFQDAVALFSRSFDVLQPKLNTHLAEVHPNTRHWMKHPDFDIRQVPATRMVDALSALRKNDDGSLDRTKSLETLLSLFQNRDCTDPRDRVYGLLGLATDGAAIDIDYKKSVFEVYKEVVQHSVRTTQSLDIICRPWAVDSGNPQIGSPNLPSWIINWGDRGDFSSRANGRPASSRMTSETFVGIGENVPYSASGAGKYFKAPVVDFPGTTMICGKTIQSTHLLVRGIEIGRITFGTEPMADRIIPKICFEKLGRGLCGRSNVSLEGRKVPDRLWRTLVADRGSNNAPCPSWYRRIAQCSLDDNLCNGHLNIDRAIYNMSTYGADFLTRVRSVIFNRVFFEAVSTHYNDTKAEETLVGLGTYGTTQGDVLTILYGCSVPVVLRPSHEINGSTEYQMIGEAFVYGRMEGETFHSSYRAKTFRIV